MQIITPTYRNNNRPISFQKFMEVKGSKNELKSFRNDLRNNNQEFMSFIVNKKNNTSALYLFTGKDSEKLINLMINNKNFTNVRHDIKNFMNKKCKTYKLENIYQNLKNKKFKLKNL